MYITLEECINHSDISSHFALYHAGENHKEGGLSSQVVYPVSRLPAERQVSQCLQRGL